MTLCILCKRQFASPEMLLRHERESKLHAENLEKQRQEEKMTIYGMTRAGDSNAASSFASSSTASSSSSSSSSSVPIDENTNPVSDAELNIINQLSECTRNILGLNRLIADRNGDVSSLTESRRALLSAMFTLNKLFYDMVASRGCADVPIHLGVILLCPRLYDRSYDYALIVAKSDDPENNKSIKYVWIRPRSVFEMVSEGIQIMLDQTRPGTREESSPPLAAGDECYALCSNDGIWHRSWVSKVDTVNNVVFVEFDIALLEGSLVPLKIDELAIYRSTVSNPFEETSDDDRYSCENEHC